MSVLENLYMPRISTGPATPIARDERRLEWRPFREADRSIFVSSTPFYDGEPARVAEIAIDGHPGHVIMDAVAAFAIFTTSDGERLEAYAPHYAVLNLRRSMTVGELLNEGFEPA